MPDAGAVSPSSDTDCQSDLWLRSSWDVIARVMQLLYRAELEPKSLHAEVKHNLILLDGVMCVCYFSLFVILPLGPNRFIYIAPIIQPRFTLELGVIWFA